MQQLKQLKEEYNAYIKRLNKAMIYFETAPPGDAEKWVDAFNKLVFESGNILIKIQVLGCQVTPDEILRGFEVV